MPKFIHQSLFVRIGFTVFVFHMLILMAMVLFGLQFSREKPNSILSGELIELESAVISKVVVHRLSVQKQIPQASEPIKQAFLDELDRVSETSNHSAAALILMSSTDSIILNNPKPPYPISSRENGEQGRVLLNACVTEQGVVHSLELSRTSGYPALDRSALNTVRLWKFSPAMQNRQPTPVCYRLPINFVLSY